MKKGILIILLSCVGVFVTGEIVLRYVWGFAHAPLYYESNEYEYMFCPSQSGMRFGNRYLFNKYGMRSEEVDSTKVKVLGLGDSVLFGGVTMEQDSTASYVFNRITGMQMLSICCGSWGPDNCAAYLKKYGTFDAKALILLVSSHDAYDNMDFTPVVGKHVSYPKVQYKSAWGEVIIRYILPRLKMRFGMPTSMDPDASVVNNEGIKKGGTAFNPGFHQLKQIADSLQIPLMVFLHPELTELRNGCYNRQGKEIMDWCNQNDVMCITELAEGITEDCYKDKIHTSSAGAHFEGELMAKYISSMLFQAE